MTRTSRLELCTACAAALCLSACGGGAGRRVEPSPALPRDVGRVLAARTDEVAVALDAGDGCHGATLARRLQRDTIAAINAGRVPPALQEQLSGSVNDLAARIVCVPEPPARQRHEKHGRGKHKGHEKKGEEGD